MLTTRELCPHTIATCTYTVAAYNYTVAAYNYTVATCTNYNRNVRLCCINMYLHVYCSNVNLHCIAQYSSIMYTIYNNNNLFIYIVQLSIHVSMP